MTCGKYGANGLTAETQIRKNKDCDVREICFVFLTDLEAILYLGETDSRWALVAQMKEQNQDLIDAL